AHQVVFGDRLRGRGCQFPPIDDADADMTLPDVDIPHLLVGAFLRDRLLDIRLNLVLRDIGPGTVLTRRLRITLRRQRGNRADRSSQSQHYLSHLCLQSFSPTLERKARQAREDDFPVIASPKWPAG